MDGVLGNKTTLKKKVRTRLSRWSEYKVNVLGLYPSGNKSKASGRTKKNGITRKHQHSSRIKNGLLIKHLRQIS